MTENRSEREGRSVDSLEWLDGEFDLAEARALLQLRLEEIRSEASAARLEARAAHLQRMIRQLDRQEAASDRTRQPAKVSRVDPSATDGGAVSPPAAATLFPDAGTRFESWQDIRAALARPVDATAAEAPRSAAESVSTSGKSTARECPQEPDAASPIPSHATPVRDLQPSGNGPKVRPHGKQIKSVPAPHFDPLPRRAKTAADAGVGPAFDVAAKSGASPPLSDGKEGKQGQSRRRRPAPWLVSAISHAGILALLAAIGLRPPPPRDQIALTASPERAPDVPIEMVSLATAEPIEPIETTALVESTVDAGTDPVVGEVLVPTVAWDARGGEGPGMSSGPTADVAAMTLRPAHGISDVQFCGVQGGGNHFVYLVDSSGSMGDGFASARAELLRSIARLGADQRFYVVFFDEEPDFMRLKDADRDEPKSVVATPAHKQALRRWVMSVAQDRGRAPYDPLRFALSLRPDVIFLLSDGEFPQGIEDLLRDENRVENLFGQSRPISIVHTIGYHSGQGEDRMKRIAEANGGQYRFVPRGPE